MGALEGPAAAWELPRRGEAGGGLRKGRLTMSISVTCDCGKQLQVKDELEGKRVRCPACGQPVLVTAASAGKGKPAPSKAGKGQRPDDDDADEAEEDRPRSTARKGKKGRPARDTSNTALWFVIGGGVAVLVLVVLVAILVINRLGKKGQEKAAESKPITWGPASGPQGGPAGPPAPDGQAGPLPQNRQSGPPVQGEGAGGVAAFLDQEKEVGPQLEWNREVTSRMGGTFSFRVTSQGPFAVTVVTDAAYKAVVSGGGQLPRKEDILLRVDSQGPSVDGKVTVPPGSSWFIIANQTNQTVRLHLLCFVPNNQ
jgi:hypothetical protein